MSPMVQQLHMCACLLRCLFVNFGTAMGGFSSQTKALKLHRLGVFSANHHKKHPIWAKLSFFFLFVILVY